MQKFVAAISELKKAMEEADGEADENGNLVGALHGVSKLLYTCTLYMILKLQIYALTHVLVHVCSNER